KTFRIFSSTYRNRRNRFELRMKLVAEFINWQVNR
ncbi:IS5/IS1182 family transposase, partial [Acinetobacter sp. c2-A9]